MKTSVLSGLGRKAEIASRYWHTLRHLRRSQLYGRAWFQIYTPRPDQNPAPPPRPLAGCWVMPVAMPASQHGPAQFAFLNSPGAAETAAGWNAPDKPKLWLYNLHYFDDLNAEGAQTRAHWHASLVRRWIAENPPGHGNGWEPYPLSLRIVNWIKNAIRTGGPGSGEIRDSLAVQVRYLRHRLEWHLLGNHLFANAKALIFAGCWFDGEEARAWRNKGLAILERELSEQILPDGGHFELSPMYHSIILGDLLDLINLARAYPATIPDAVAAHWRATAGRMRAWLAAMVHPDGDIAFFNDAAFAVAPRLADLERYAERLGLGPAPAPARGVTHLEASGYVRVESADMVAILDVARIGPDYLPGHAHADTLSFECSLFGRRVIVNSGTSTYERGPQRNHERSTSAHSTVEIDGENSSEVWGAFRVARRARPVELALSENGGELRVACAHDGYRRLPGRPVHRREWRFFPAGLTVADTLTGSFSRAIARFYLHPDVEIGAGRDRHANMLALPSGHRAACTIAGGEPTIVATIWHEQFGMGSRNHCLEIGMTAPSCRLRLNW